MNNLTVGLAILGGLLLAAIVAYNTWTARHSAPRLASAELDVSQPSSHDNPSNMDAQDSNAAGVVMPAQAEMAFAPVSSLEKPPNLDALIDVIAPISLELGEQVSGDAVLSAMPTTRRAGTKPFGVEGLNANTQIWEAPVPGQRYKALQAGVQMANRSGALNEIEYSEFVMKTQAFADALEGTSDFPEMLEEVARARELDQFASSHDAQLSFTLRARSAAWSPGFVQQHAARHGFVLGAIPGRMVLSASKPNSPATLSLSFDTQAALADDPDQAAVRQVALSLDVGQVHRSETPFSTLCKLSNLLAQSMDAIITDDDGQPIQLEAMKVIEADIEKLYDALDARDLSAGSVLARRLFS